jgi:hypothetical protein
MNCLISEGLVLCRAGQSEGISVVLSYFPAGKVRGLSGDGGFFVRL